MISPPFLQPDDTLGIVAPGRKPTAESIDAAKSILTSWGYRVIGGNHVLDNKHSYLSSVDENRLADLQNMLDDATVKAIICARGGYGTTRIIDQLDFTRFLQSPKWICGFSDITALHIKLQTLGIQSIHSTMPVLFTKPESKSSVESLRLILRGDSVLINADNPEKNNKPGEVSGELIGGNLSLLVDSLGTSSALPTDGKILVIEEVDEYVYKIDRMLVQLKRAGKFDKLAGLAVGQFSQVKETELPFGEGISQLIHWHLKDYSFPIGFNFPIGHDHPNFSVRLGGTASLKVGNSNAQLLQS